MNTVGPAPAISRNRILASLSEQDYARLQPYLELVHVDVREIVYDVGRAIKQVFFVETGVLSIVSVMADGSSVEAATVGYEGLLGVPVFLDTDRSATQAFCQVDCDALAMRSADFRRLIDEAAGLRIMLNRYTQALFTQIAQSAACNRLHAVRERAARWLLQTHDRMDQQNFALTHDFLAQMLGVRRATVTETMGDLQQRGLIEYEYGRVRVIDRAGLERASCECYAIVRSEFDRLLDGRHTPSPLDGLETSRDGITTLNVGVPRSNPD